MIREKLANDIALMAEQLLDQHVKTAGLNWQREAKNVGLGLAGALGIAGLGQAAYVAGDQLGRAIHEKNLADQAYADQLESQAYSNTIDANRRHKAHEAGYVPIGDALPEADRAIQAQRAKQRVNLNYLNDLAFPDTMVGSSNSSFRTGDDVTHYNDNLLYSLGG